MLEYRVARPSAAVSAPVSAVFSDSEIMSANASGLKLSAYYVAEECYRGESWEVVSASEMRKEWEAEADKEEYPTFSEALEELTAMGGYFCPIEKFFRLKVSGRWLAYRGEYYAAESYAEAEETAFSIVSDSIVETGKTPKIEIAGFYAPSALFEIYRNINNNNPYGNDCLNVRFKYFSTALWVTPSGNIGWRHYGQSANANTIKDLLWVITVIFRATPDQFLKMYIPESKSVLLPGVSSAE